MSSYPCGICSFECDGNKNIACDCCNLWYHQKCENLNRLIFSFLSKTSLVYVCSRCLLDNDGNFDYLAGLKRLNENGNSVESAKLELIFMRFLPSKFLSPDDLEPSVMVTDTIATTLLGNNSDFLASEDNREWQILSF